MTPNIGNAMRSYRRSRRCARRLPRHGIGLEAQHVHFPGYPAGIVADIGEYAQQPDRSAKYVGIALISDRDAFKQQWFAQLSQDLVTTRNKLDEARASYEKALKHQDLVRWTAAEPSVVLTMARLSVGSVLKPGDPFITLMPIDTKLEAEIRISSRDIGFVRAGDPCTMKVDAFNAAEHGTASGKVRWISEGAFTTDEDGKPLDYTYYKARCSVDSSNFKDVPSNFRLIPGMTLQGTSISARDPLRCICLAECSRLCERPCVSHDAFGAIAFRVVSTGFRVFQRQPF